MPTADPADLRSYYEYVDDEAYDALFALFAEEVVYHRPGQEPIEGKGEFERFYRDERPIEAGTHEVDAIYADGDTAVARGRFTGVLEGEEVAFGFADVHRFDGEGLITERWTYTDTGRV
jgi:uncharacterized protein